MDGADPGGRMKSSQQTSYVHVDHGSRIWIPLRVEERLAWRFVCASFIISAFDLGCYHNNDDGDGV